MNPPAALRGFAVMLLALMAGLGMGTCVTLAHGSKPRDNIRAALAALPVFHADREAPGKAEQLDRIADAIDRHTQDPRVAAFVIAWGWHETKFSLDVMDGHCPPPRCDKGRARGGFQEHRNGRPLDEWERLHGLENIDFQVESAVRRARGMLGMCKTAEGAYRAMSGRGCSGPLPDAAERVRTFLGVRSRL